MSGTVKRGHARLVAALSRRGWTKYKLAQALGTRDSVVAKIFARERGVGPGLAARIERVLDGEVPASAWTVDASPKDQARFEAGYEALIERGRVRFRAQPALPEAQ